MSLYLGSLCFSLWRCLLSCRRALLRRACSILLTPSCSYLDTLMSLLSSRLNSPSLKLSWDIGCTIKNQLSDKISSANHCKKNYILGCFDSETIMEKGLFCSSLHILKYCSQLLKTVQFWAVCTMLLQHLIMYFCTYVSLSGKHLFLD